MERIEKSLQEKLKILCNFRGKYFSITKIGQKLQFQPFGLKHLGEKLQSINKLKYPKQTQIMGVLNITTNSFSDGGDFLDFENAKNTLTN